MRAIVSRAAAAAALALLGGLLVARAKAEDPPPAGASEPRLDDTGFEALPPAKPGEWRAEFPDEKPQSVSDYSRDVKNKATPERRTIYIQPLGAIAKDHAALLETTRAYCEVYFQCATKLLPPLDPPAKAWVKKRAQFDGDKLLRFLEPRVPADAIAVGGFLAEDIYSGDLNFVFGVATLEKRVGIYSTARLEEKYAGMPASAGLERRTIAVASHELGHMFGIQHCLFYRCVMNGSNSLEESDGQPLLACPVDLEKLRRNVGFDPEKRLADLEKFYEARGYGAEAAFCKARRAGPVVR